MITEEDIHRMKKEELNIPKKLVVIDTFQFFEIEIPKDVDTEFFLNSDLCREKCAELLLNYTIDLSLEKVMTKNSKGEWE